MLSKPIPLSGALTSGKGTITAAGATGTFSFTMVPMPSSGATGNKVVANGAFSVKF